MNELIDSIRSIAEQLGLYNIASGILPLYDFKEEALIILEKLLLQELSFKQEKKYKILKGRSHLPEFKSFDDFDNKFQPVVTDQLIERIKRMVWLEDRRNMILMGSSGTGKTHIAVAIGYYAIRNDFKVFYATMSDLLYFLNTKDIIGKSKTRLGYIKNCDLLIIDELGYKPISNEDAVKLYDLINQVIKSASIIVTTNRSFDQWPAIFGDGAMAQTILDRLIGACQVLDLGDKSYRVASHQNL